ncbi:MAG: 3-deoxy-manno-octulosonate cytidylyltransferase, partial [Gemmatimonadota bacterium]|nr:3-deoxy-manno-octulosonate cytidylyltransferase [Gemmatimonadota bacterium]
DRVKVVVGGDGVARCFARSLSASAAWHGEGDVRRHLGIYAYSRSALARWAAAPPGVEERAEGLEQLRPLQLGMSVGVVRYDAPAPPAVDTIDDLSAAERYMTLSIQRVG